MCDSLEQLRKLHARCEALRENATLMVIGEEEACFFFQAEGERLIRVPVGYGLISARYFRHTPPTPDEIEAAINYLEDEIERVVPAVANTDYSLFSDEAFIREFAALCGVADASVMQLSREDLEKLFGQYAEVSMGRPARGQEREASAMFYAQLLIVREFLHHLKFDTIHIIEAGAEEPGR